MEWIRSSYSAQPEATRVAIVAVAAASATLLATSFLQKSTSKHVKAAEEEEEVPAGWESLPTPRLLPECYPVVGHLMMIRADGSPIDTIGSIAIKNGPIFRLQVFNNNLVVISDVDLVADVNKRTSDFGKM
jgi:hypothetical protein